MKISEPTPAASSPGASTTPSIAPPIPATSIIRNAARRGEPRSVLIAAKLPAAPITTLAISGASRLTRWMARTPEAAADRDRRRLRAEDDPEAEGGERGSDDPGELDRRHGSGCLEPLRRLVPCRSRQVPDRERHEQAAQRKQRNRPPGGLALEAEVAGQGAVQILLQLGEAHEEEVRSRRHRHADERAEQEQHDVRAAPEKLERTRRSPVDGAVCASGRPSCSTAVLSPFSTARNAATLPPKPQAMTTTS